MSVLITPQDLAQTYKSQSYEDAWQSVEDYQRVLEYTGQHPNKGSSAVASALDLPRGRVHPWMNGSRPAPVRAIQIAEENGWLPLATDDTVFSVFNRLVAWIFSRGSVTEAEYTPLFSCERETEQERLGDLFSAIGVDYAIFREDSTARATEARITEHSTIVGRLLVLLGAPVGPRVEASRLPSYLLPQAHSGSRDAVIETEEPPLTKTTVTPDMDASQQLTSAESQKLARTFAETYLANTARYWEWRDGYVVKHDNRTKEYFQALANIFECASENTGVDVNSDSLFLPAPLAENLCPGMSER